MPRSLRLAVSYAAVFLACVAVYLSGWGRSATSAQGPRPPVPSTSLALPDDRPVPAGLEKATLASGCFWCTESDFDEVKGVISTTSGYTGGRVVRPTYEQVSSGGTGHVESIEILFDPRVVTFDQLLDHYWHNVDFFNDHGQFCDLGEQYRPVIFVYGNAQRAVAEASKARLQQRFAQRVVVEIVDATVFYPAEDYHQDYSGKNYVRYCVYRWGCGRDQRLAEIWKNAS
ncbi:MAG: peptide-methionine (S)-S-oxide reductase MsrA [Vicinamibacterales bacterium]